MSADAMLAGSVDETAGNLGADGTAYRRLLEPLVRDATLTLPDVLAPLRSVPGHPLAMARFGLDGLPPASLLVRRFRSPETRAMFAGAAAHTMRPLTAPVTGAFGLTLMIIAHAVGWPVVEGGSARLVDALVAELTSLGGTLETGRWVTSLADLPAARAVLLDVTPRQLVALAGESIGARSRRTLERFRYGTGVCKVDWALSGPVPWQAAPCREAGTVHDGGAATLRQTFFRPTLRWNPYRTPLPGVYLCSSSTPPGGGVHGMCGLGAARTALADLGVKT